MPGSRADRRRAERRRAERVVGGGRPGAAGAAASAPWERDYFRMTLAGIFAGVAIVFVVCVARFIDSQITWYLAVDQFGYLQFAHDLLQGKIFHDWEPAQLLGRLMPPRTDVLAQTYVYDHGRMYCRYAPGFPMLLAGWIALLGDLGAPYLNPTIYVSLLALMIAFGWRITRSPWHGLLATAIVVLLPTQMYFWALTMTRDLSAHLFAFVGLFLLLPNRRRLEARRVFLAAVPLGFAASIRNDAVLYLIPAMLIATSRWWGERAALQAMLRRAGLGAAGVLLGLLPTLGFNAIATGNPLRPTQGMELQQFFPTSPPAAETGARVGYPSPGWRGSTTAQVSGGGLKLSNLPITIQGNWRIVQTVYGPVLLGLAAAGALVSLILRPMLFLVAVPYAVVAFLFFSCWVRPDRRYLIGAHLLAPILVAEGVLGPIDLIRRIARRRGDATAQVIAVALAVVGLATAAWFSPLRDPAITALRTPAPTALPTITWVLPLGLAVGTMAAALSPRLRVTAVVAPALAIALATVAAVRAQQSTGRAAFQKPEMLRARETFRREFEPGSIVITSEGLGRPAENIEYYSGVAKALYLTDLERWHVDIGVAATAFLAGGRRPYLLIGTEPPETAHRAQLVADLNKNGLVTELVARIPPTRNMEYFVAAPFHRGLPLELYRVTFPFLEQTRQEQGPRWNKQ